MVIELVGGFQISWGLTNQNGNVIWIEWDIYIYIPVVPRKAVAEVSKIGNL